MLALVVRDGQIERIDLRVGPDSGAAHIHELVGDTFGSCFHVPGDGAARKIVGWCDDNFLLKANRPAWNVMLSPLSLYRGGYAIAGPIVIVGHYGPDTAALSELEAAAFQIGGVAMTDGGLVLPVLNFTPEYDV